MAFRSATLALASLASLAAFAHLHGEVDPDGFHALLRRELVSEPLRWNAIENEHLVAGEINGSAAEFHIDSGAARSILALDTANRLDLAVWDTGRTQAGIGGREKIFSTKIDTLRVGRSIRAGSQPMLVLDMAERLGSDGLIGGDILAATGAVIDHRDHLLFARPDPSAPFDLSSAARAHGMVGVPLEREGNYHFLSVKIGDTDLRFLLDTGSQQSLLDLKTAGNLGLSLLETEVRAAGVGEKSRKAQLTSVDKLELGAVTLRKTPMLVMPVSAFGKTSSREFHGILGAEFLFASGAVFDAGRRRLYLPPGDLDVRPYAKTGSEILDSDSDLAVLCRKSTWIGGVRILRFTLESTESRVKSPDPTKTAVRLELEIIDTLKSADAAEIPPPDTLTVLIPHSDTVADWAAGVLGRNPRKLLFLPEAASESHPPNWSRCLFTDGEIPRQQLRKVLETPKTPGDQITKDR